jgi:hypothetical protein
VTIRHHRVAAWTAGLTNAKTGEDLHVPVTHTAGGSCSHRRQEAMGPKEHLSIIGFTAVESAVTSTDHRPERK